MEHLLLPSQRAWESVRHLHWAAVVCIMSIRAHAADGPEGPARGVARIGNAVGVGLQEVETALDAVLDAAREDEEPFKKQTTCEEEEGCEAEEGALVVLVCRR